MTNAKGMSLLAAFVVIASGAGAFVIISDTADGAMTNLNAADIVNGTYHYPSAGDVFVITGVKSLGSSFSPYLQHNLSGTTLTITIPDVSQYGYLSNGLPVSLYDTNDVYHYMYLHSSANWPQTSLDVTVGGLSSSELIPVYLLVGSSVSVRGLSDTDESTGFYTHINSVTAGFGLTRSAGDPDEVYGGDLGQVTGTLNKAGTVKIAVANHIDGDIGGVLDSGDYELTIIGVSNDVTATLDFDANGGAGGPSSLTYTGPSTDDHVFTIPGEMPTKSGKYFMGWSKNPSASSPSHMAGGTISVGASETVTLYAVWGSFNVSPQYMVLGDTLVVTPVAAGYTVSASGMSGVSASGNTVTISPNTVGTFTVTVTCNGGSASFTVKVVEPLDFTNAPSAGIIKR